jgi:threonine aldolase
MRSDPATLAKLVDVFYVGGTKNGALIGEAIVIGNPELQDHFRYNLRQRGGLLAKGRAVSLQFLELFRDNLYFEIARHANDLAQQLEAGISECGYQILVEAPTNQVFPGPNPVIACSRVWVSCLGRSMRKTPSFDSGATERMRSLSF